MTRQRSRHIREKLANGSPRLCGGGRALEPEELPSVALVKYKPAKNDCKRCVIVMRARMK